MLDAHSSPADHPSDSVPERRLDTKANGGEVPFSLDEVFFSRTDERGVIAAGNDVFQRLSGYGWGDLIGAPHKIVRHGDMPKGLYWQFWNTIQSGKPIGAYVKNRAEDGRYYWVFACIVPLEGGYLSARIKPSSEMFEIVRREYAVLVEEEKSEEITPEQSAKRLLARLAGLGFESYQDFEAHALSEELMARQTGLGRGEHVRIAKFRKMLAAAGELKAATDQLILEFEAVRIIPHNMRVMASRLEPTGGPFNTLSGNYGSMSAEMSEWFESNVVGENSNFATIASSVNSSMFVEGVIEILLQCDEQLKHESDRLAEIDVPGERKILNSLIERYRETLVENQTLVYEEARRIGLACHGMNRHVLGLSTTRVLCKIESARMGSVGDGLTDIISQLGRFQEKIGDQLGVIEGLSDEIQAVTQSLIEK